MNENGKPFWQSKTLWFGLLYIVAGVAGVFGFAEYQPDQNVVEALAVVTGFITIVLRLVTKRPVNVRAKL